MNVSEYWLISAPGSPTCGATWDKLYQATSSGNLSTNWRFPIPDLKVGTLDQLVGLSDDLGKVDAYVESVVRKVAHYMVDVLEDQRDKVVENLLANGMDLPTYLTKFSWDMAKYPIKQSLKNLADMISKQVSQIESDLKVKSQAYNNLKTNIQNVEKKQSGSLMTRNLGNLVNKDHFILGSEYLTTLLVVVPINLLNEWHSIYEKLTPMIAPRSSQLIFQDSDHALVNVSLFRKVVDDFKFKAREHKFIVRDFVYDPDELEAGKCEITKLTTDKKKQFGPLVRWLRVNFSEAFISCIHVKALRVFVESVLRFGLPVNFQAMLLLPQKKTQKKLRDVLNNLYSHLDSSGGVNEPMDIPAGLGFNQEYYPYVYYKINIDMIGQSGML
uniref:V-type proton ATPase subunit C n=1 Tax=Caligus rogercresseyi TaxID=217165 RepID=C1BQF2_CALRO|nr:Vacuolar proton pump subunit C [Caligus rogercresseyi]|eukprot:TRINITY_DN1839_c0_g1_i2.p1 TRINITY_DN1839_c0_g1~~TRINITY_DN1839_c0_g1_i2.p1  ORF type:complete len:385 (-),score=70.17 TRINITY_DN1839_c0_g1_i2:421-1575(-)